MKINLSYSWLESPRWTRLRMLLGIRVTNFLISKSIQRRRSERIAWLLERNLMDPPPPPPPTLVQKLTQFLKKIMMSILAIPHLRREVQEEVDDDECNNSLLPELNEDVIVYEIISRLSAEEVRPMRMVCKQWLDTIDNNSNFAYLNLAHSQPGLLVQQPEVLCGMKTYFMKVEQESKTVTVKPINIGYEFLVSGSCNGLILVRCHKTYQFFVINPMTRTSVEIPRPPPQYHRLGISLGFDSRAGEYKVLWHFYNKKLQEREGFMVFLVGSSTASWRMIDFPLDVNQWTLSKLTWADGAWHLLAYPSGLQHLPHQVLPSGDQETFLVSLNPSSQRFIQTRAPFSETRPALMEVEGRLTMTVCTNPDQLDIWVLRDLNGAEWRKKHSIKFDSLKGFLHGNSFTPALLNYDVMVFQCTCMCFNGWRAYDIKHGKGYAIKGIKTSITPSCYYTIAHTNSLVR